MTLFCSLTNWKKQTKCSGQWDFQNSGLKSEIELEVNKGRIIIKPISKNREYWEIAFQKMAINRDDILLDPETLMEQSKWDKEEWEW